MQPCPPRRASRAQSAASRLFGSGDRRHRWCRRGRNSRRPRPRPSRRRCRLHDAQATEGPRRILVAQGHQDGGADRDRRLDARRRRQRARPASSPSRAPCSSQSPITAFQKPSTVQGAPNRKATKITISATLQPPAPSTCAKPSSSSRQGREIERQNQPAPRAERARPPAARQASCPSWQAPAHPAGLARAGWNVVGAGRWFMAGSVMDGSNRTGGKTGQQGRPARYGAGADIPQQSRPRTMRPWRSGMWARVNAP